MATMNISLPAQMKAWVEAQSADGRYANSSDYVRDLIRREQVKAEKIAHMQRLVEEAQASGFSEKTPRQVFEHAKAEWRRRTTLEQAANASLEPREERIDRLRALVNEAERSGVSSKSVMEIFAEAEHRHRQDAP